MQLVRSFRLPRLFAGAALALSLLLSVLSPLATSAAIRSCRTDPIVTLSNGYSFHITASLATDASDVQSIVYGIHVPQGVALTKVTYTGGSLSSKEKVVFAADQPAGTYIADNVVTTGTTGVATTITVSVGSASLSASGTSNQHIVIQVNGVP